MSTRACGKVQCMKISVIIPVYNTDHGFLKTCLDSLVSQDFDDYEVIAVNDGSTNGCSEVLKDYASRYDFIKHVDQENAGTSVARNTGLSNAEGDYIMFVDADDFVSEGILRSSYEKAESEGCDILFFGYNTSYSNREINRVMKDPDPSIWERDALELAVLKGDKRLGPVDVGAPWGKLIRHDIIRDNGIKYTPGLIKGQDTVFILHLIDHCSRFSYLSICGYHYRISGSSVSHRYNPYIVSIMEKTLNAYMSFVDTRNKGDEFKDAVEKKYLKVLLGEYLELLYLHPASKDSMEKRISDIKLLIGREPYRSIIKSTDPASLGLMHRVMLYFLKKESIRPVFAVKKAEMFMRDRVIHKFS